MTSVWETTGARDGRLPVHPLDLRNVRRLPSNCRLHSARTHERIRSGSARLLPPNGIATDGLSVFWRSVISCTTFAVRFLVFRCIARGRIIYRGGELRCWATLWHKRQDTEQCVTDRYGTDAQSDQSARRQVGCHCPEHQPWATSAFPKAARRSLRKPPRKNRRPDKHRSACQRPGPGPTILARTKIDQTYRTHAD